MKAGVFNEKTGKLVGLELVGEDDDVMIIADNGVIIRTKANSISKITRDTIGVKVMRLDSGTKVSCVAIADIVAEDITGESGEEPIIIDDPIEDAGRINKNKQKPPIFKGGFLLKKQNNKKT